MAEPGTLYVVATPIGNLEDITLRARRVLGEVDLIAAEDTRVTRKLLARYDLHRPLTSYHAHSGPRKLAALVARLQAGESIALVSEAGLPGISDPGERLIAACIAAAVPVTVIPGPSVLVSALVVSGLPTASFHYLGFLPRKQGEQRRAFAAVAELPATLIFFEAPGRLVATLRSAREALGNRPAAVARELTKRFEEVVRGSLEELISHFTEKPPRGEITVVVGGARETRRAEAGLLPLEALAAVRAKRAAGLSHRQAVAEVAAELGVSRRDLYRATLDEKREPQ